jgi:asparagine synthase (glutamine-hydrolysing)
MCGIVGLHQTSVPIDPERFGRMRDSLIHRGPDGAGTWIANDGHLALGHRRLAILDLSIAGAQPMERDGLRIVFNGEIYNYRELREELIRAGLTFSSGTDTEVLLGAYRVWGEAFLARLDGMFSFCIHDVARQRLFFAWDRAGEKPLYIARSKGRLAFASELKALFADPSQARRIDPVGLNDYLAYGSPSSGNSLVAGISKLPAASAATYALDSGTWHQWRWWGLPNHDPEPDIDISALADRLEILLEASVRRQMIADVPVGILLSGGLDSSLITAMASRASSEVRTFTIGFPGYRKNDETDFARIVADHFSTKHTVLAAEDISTDLLLDVGRRFCEPLADSSQLPTFLVSRLIREEATVALGGDGGDELFGGYLQHALTSHHATARRWIPKSVRTLMSQLVPLISPTGIRGRNYLSSLAGPLSCGYLGVNQFFGPRDRLKILGAAFDVDLNPEVAKVNSVSAELGEPGMFMAADFRTYLCDDILTKVDRTSMMNSLEVRAPFLGRELIEFAYREVPNNLRVMKGRRKVLVKHLAKRLLPAKLDLERKQGFSIPIADWLNGRWGDVVYDLLQAAPPWFLSREGIADLIDGQRQGRHNGERIFALAMLELWRQEYGMQP